MPAARGAREDGEQPLELLGLESLRQRELAQAVLEQQPGHGIAALVGLRMHDHTVPGELGVGDGDDEVLEFAQSGGNAFLTFLTALR